MSNNLLRTIQSLTLEQLKQEIDTNNYVNKKLRDYEEGKKTIESFTNIQKMDDDVKFSLLVYAIYKIKSSQQKSNL